MATAQQFDGEGAYKLRWDDTSQGPRIVDHYLVDSRVPFDVLSATGLPERGELYPDTLSRVVNRSPEFNGTLAQGNTVVRVEYAPPSGGLIVTQNTWTEIRPAIQGETVYFPADDDGEAAAGAKQLGGGRGAPARSAIIEAAVHRYFTGSIPGSTLALSQAFGSPPTLNQSSFVLPRIGGPNSVNSFSVAPRQALYLGATPRDLSDGRYELVFKLHYQASWLYAEEPIAADGTATGDQTLAQLYGTQVWGTLIV
ncbi:MAG: hypothetical protein AAGF47_03800 [Planctomycetota bacterium]